MKAEACRSGCPPNVDNAFLIFRGDDEFVAIALGLFNAFELNATSTRLSRRRAIIVSIKSASAAVEGSVGVERAEGVKARRYRTALGYATKL